MFLIDSQISVSRFLPALEAEEEIHLREATRVAGRAILLAAVLMENIFFR